MESIEHLNTITCKLLDKIDLETLSKENPQVQTVYEFMCLIEPMTITELENYPEMENELFAAMSEEDFCVYLNKRYGRRITTWEECRITHYLKFN